MVVFLWSPGIFNNTLNCSGSKYFFAAVSQIGDAGDRRRHSDAIVERGNRPAIRPAAGPARDTKAVGVHFRPRAEVVERPDAVPGLDARRRVTARVPPPRAFAVSAVVY